MSLLEVFYNKEAEQCYFQGCSNGGRMAHMAALKYLQMFNGIISGTPSMLKCEVGQNGASCLTDAELDVIKKWRQGPQNQAGEQLHPGGVRKVQKDSGGYRLTGKSESGGKLALLFAKGFGAYMAFEDDPGASCSPLDFDPETDPKRLGAMARVYNSDRPDLKTFIAAGGKMIVWHGWADAIVTPCKTID